MTGVRSPRRLGHRAVAAVLVSVVGLVGLTGAAAAAPATTTAAVALAAAKPKPVTISWTVAPSTAKGPDGRTNFSYTNVKPGTELKDYIGITNFSTRPIDFKLYAVDGVTTSAGSLGLASATQRKVDLGTMVKLAAGSVRLPPHARANVPFTVLLPADTTPGDHVGGIVASVTEALNGGRVAREDRIGVAMYVRVAGALHPTLGIESVSTSGYHGTPNPFAGGSTTVSYTVHNTGNVRLGADQQVRITGLFGIPLVTVHPKALEELLPGATVRVKTTLTGIFPLAPLGVHITVTPTPVQGSPGLRVPLRPAAYAVGLGALPWPQLVVLAVLVALGYGLVRWLRSRRTRQARAVAAAVEQGRREAAAELTAVGAPDQPGPSGTETSPE
jgi:WxL interacting protein linking bacterial and host surfaces